MRKLSTAAMAAKLIRNDLKKEFPGINFSVKSSRYSVNIDWENGPTSKDVKDITDKYIYGHFCPMTDLYNYTNINRDIPQVQYIFTNREITENIISSMFEERKDSYHIWSESLDIDDGQNGKFFEAWGYCTPREYLLAELSKNDLTQGHKNEED